MNTKTKKLLQQYEQDILDAWHIAHNNKNVKITLSLAQAGVCGERICQAIYIRKYGVIPPNSKTFHKLILLFFNEDVFNMPLKIMFNTIRTSSAHSRHQSTIIEKAFMDKIRLMLIDVVIWYQKKYKMRFPNLKLTQYRSILYKKPAGVFYKNVKLGHLSQESFEKNMNNETLLSYVPKEKKLLRTPVYTSLLIDVSASMRAYSDQVILGHKEALSAIRGSMICKQGALFLMQHLFNHESKLLHSLSKVDKMANDSVVPLNLNNYRPHSTTALYDTLYEAINLICLEVDSLKLNKGKKPEIIIGVMTDGIDNESKSYTTEDIKRLMNHLKQENVIKSSVLIGWTNDNGLDFSHIKSLQRQIGFEEAIALKQSDPKAIRQAFNLFSQRVV